MPLPALKKRICLCGCGKVYTPTRSDQKYATQACKVRSYRARKRGTWFGEMSLADQMTWKGLRESADPIAVRIALAAELEGKAHGGLAASQLLYKIEFIFQGENDPIARKKLGAAYPVEVIDAVLLPLAS